jgi:hypothetical protein
MLRTWMIGGAATALLWAAPFYAAHAAPVGVATGANAAEHASAVEKVARRRCWWQDGERHCTRARYRPRAYDDGYYGWTYGRPRPEDYPTGSTAWWRAMDYEGRGGHGRLP